MAREQFEHRVADQDARGRLEEGIPEAGRRARGVPRELERRSRRAGGKDRQVVSVFHDPAQRLDALDRVGPLALDEARLRAVEGSQDGGGAAAEEGLGEGLLGVERAAAEQVGRRVEAGARDARVSGSGEDDRPVEAELLELFSRKAAEAVGRAVALEEKEIALFDGDEVLPQELDVLVLEGERAER